MTTKTVNFLSLLSLAALFSLLTACDPLGTRGKGDLITETRNETDFHSVQVNTCGKVIVHTDSVFKIEVTCEENIIDYLETKVENGVLTIDFDRNVYDADQLSIEVWAPEWKAFEIDGSADITVLDPISGTVLSLEIDGSGNMTFNQIDYDKAKAEVDGSGDIDLAGMVNDLVCDINGSGDIFALDCVAQNAKVNIDGSGDIKLNVVESLDVEINGSGDVEYKGSPSVTVDISGSGTVRKI